MKIFVANRKRNKGRFDLIKGSTLMSPLLILASVPTSNTGVFPDKFLSSRGPKLGRSNPNRAVSPRISHDTISSNRSTRRMGSHLSNHMDSPKVDFPSISRGRMCTSEPKKLHPKKLIKDGPKKHRKDRRVDV